jgi:hypothetical protein
MAGLKLEERSLRAVGIIDEGAAIGGRPVKKVGMCVKDDSGVMYSCTSRHLRRRNSPSAD